MSASPPPVENRPPDETQRPVALVTGAARRVGREIALALARDGWDIAVHYAASGAEAQIVVGEVKALGRRAIAVNRDLAVEHGVRSIMAECAGSLGPVTCLVNNASRIEFDRSADFRTERLLELARVNTAAPILLAQALHASLPPEMRGVVINILDQKLENPNPDFFTYTLTKAALKEATVLLAQSLAPRVRVVGVSPGLTLPAAGQTDEEFGRAHRLALLGRASTPADIAAAVVYLARAQAVTGEILNVDGGQHLTPTLRDVVFIARGKR